MVERIDLAHVHGTDRQRKWVSGGQTWRASSVVFGQLGDGRWFAEHTGHGARGDEDAYVFSADNKGRTLALRLAYRWLAAGDWRPVPAAMGPDGKPVDGLPWVRRGGTWYLDRPT